MYHRSPYTHREAAIRYKNDAIFDKILQKPSSLAPSAKVKKTYVFMIIFILFLHNMQV